MTRVLDPMHRRGLAWRQVRAAALLDCPELWRDWPPEQVWPAADRRTLSGAWLKIVAFLKARDLVAPSTLPQDVNVDRLVRAAQDLTTTHAKA